MTAEPSPPVPDQPPPYRLRVAEMAEEERPRERLERLGPQALRTDELLAILLRTGTAREDVMQIAQRLLAERDGLRGLAASDVAGIAAVHGLGQAKATTIAAAFELGRRMSVLDGDARPQVTGPEDIARLLQPEMELLPQEELRVLVLDTKHRVMAAPVLYRGTISAAPGRMAELFRTAIQRNASKIAIAHNHPSGDPTPSPDDVAFTREAVQAGALLEVPVLDHVVIGQGPRRWVSMRQRHLGFD
ncbi:MAG: UPF0758 protein [Chloroflexota bacterium]